MGYKELLLLLLLNGRTGSHSHRHDRGMRNRRVVEDSILHGVRVGSRVFQPMVSLKDCDCTCWTVKVSFKRQSTLVEVEKLRGKQGSHWIFLCPEAWIDMQKVFWDPVIINSRNARKGSVVFTDRNNQTIEPKLKRCSVNCTALIHLHYD